MGFDQGQITDIILIDLQKTFDAIDHETLPQKLYAIGFFKHSVNWFWSYLINITFLVNLDVSPVVYHRDLFIALYFFSYMLLTYPKLLNVISSFKLMIYALLVKIKILMKLKNKWRFWKHLWSICWSYFKYPFCWWQNYSRVLNTRGV